MKGNREVLKRLAEVEKKLDAQVAVPEWQKGIEQTRPLLEMLEVLHRMDEMSEAAMTLEERSAKQQREYEELDAYITEHYGEWKSWYQMTPQEREAADAESDKQAEEARKWLAGDERKQFEKEYAEFIKSKKGGSR